MVGTGTDTSYIHAMVGTDTSYIHAMVGTGTDTSYIHAMVGTGTDTSYIHTPWLALAVIPAIYTCHGWHWR